jgi:hypothetical protein
VGPDFARWVHSDCGAQINRYAVTPREQNRRRRPVARSLLALARAVSE